MGDLAFGDRCDRIANRLWSSPSWFKYNRICPLSVCPKSDYFRIRGTFLWAVTVPYNTNSKVTLFCPKNAPDHILARRALGKTWPMAADSLVFKKNSFHQNTTNIKANHPQENPAALELRENCFNRTDECCKDATFSPEASFPSFLFGSHGASF